MSEHVRIMCDSCGELSSDWPNHSGLWRRLRAAGWTGGWRDKHYCPACAAQGEAFRKEAERRDLQHKHREVLESARGSKPCA